MKLGFNLLLWTTHATREHAPILRKIKKAGADGVEIPIMEGEVAHFRDLGRILDDLGLERTGSMAILDPKTDPLSADAAVRRAAADYLRGLVDRAEALGAGVLCGPMFQLLGVFSGQGPTETEKKRAADVLRAVAPHARAAGVVLAMEPVSRFESYLVNTLKDTADLVKRVGHPSVGALFDTFHANIEEKDPVGCIRRHGKAIRHVHCSASDRGTPGEDHVDWKGTFRALHAIGYDDWLVIEAFGRALPGLAAATKIWRDLFPSSDHVIRKGLPFLRKTWGETR